ncbi:hybrid sensor histidine kinase/response regulator [Desulfosoma caldarium]|uniref:histidine kinase n=1 Tax=Desulfosoma caldarium TaxID=610254 RepID=A0A3N1VMI0_9BACT|nr:PAS domain S-box protein [Desulfosoma caldarium]ROR03269.1 PAS domain S-box-containing protein [Desulfosoma caldarium]
MARILVVDDEAAIRELVQGALKSFGYQCETAPNAAAARALLKAQDFDLVISDVIMPGENGLDLIAHVVETYPDTGTLILSALDDPALTQKALDLGIYGYVVKPFDMTSLRIHVACALKQREVQMANRRYREDLERLAEQRTRELHRQQQDYAALVTNLPCVVYTGFTDWSVAFVSEKVRDVTGYEPEVFLSGQKRWSECIVPEDLPTLSEPLKKAMARDGTFIREYRIVDAHGQIRWIQDRGRVILSPESNLDHVSGVFFDITEQKKVREALEQAKEEWERTFDAVPALIQVSDKNRRILKVNAALANRVGIPREDIIGRSCYDIIYGRLEKCPQCPWDNAESLNFPLEREVYNEHLGGYFHITSAPLYNSDGSLAGCISVSHDITALKEAEQEVRRAHWELEQLVSAISSILIGLDPQGRITRWNTMAESVFGLLSTEVLGKKLEDLPLEWQWERVQLAVESCRRKKRIHRVEDVRFTRPDGQPGFLGFTINPMRLDHDTELGLLIMGAEITQRKLLEAQLAQAQKLESIGQLAAGIAHEINTPVQFIGDNTRFLEDAFRDLSRLLEKYQELVQRARQAEDLANLVREVEEAAETIDLDYLLTEIPRAIEQTLEGVQRVAKIVLAMKEFSHPDREEKVPTDINRALENTLTVARNEWKYVADLVAELDPNLPLVPCIPGEMNQVFLNIVVNAAHAVKDAVKDQPDTKGTITVATRVVDDWCEIRVADTGTGIPEKIRHRIFDPFFTTKEVGRGTGQGLAISHHVVVEKHKGQLLFETEEGRGTTFIIRLPMESS